MIWIDKKSVLTHGGKDIKAGDEIPEKVLSNMGSDRINALVKKGLMSDGKKQAKKQDDKERAELLDKAKLLGLSPHPNTGIDKLKTMIEDENERLVLLSKARKIDDKTADDASADDLKKIIAGANGPN